MTLNITTSNAGAHYSSETSDTNDDNLKLRRMYCYSRIKIQCPIRIDYYNSLLFGSTHDVTSHLQRIQNYAARVILRLPMSSSISIHLKSLHWLPVKVRSTYKIACLCYNCHSSTAPSYVTDMQHKKPLHTRNTRSSSYTMPLLNRHAYSKATLDDRSFYFASSSVWNSIPNDVRCAPLLSSFKSRLKTYLFRSVYKD